MGSKLISPLNVFIQRLELPIRDEERTETLVRLREIAPPELSLSEGDFLIALTQEFEEWRKGESPGGLLVDAVGALLDTTQAQSLGITGGIYFALHDTLRSGGKDWRGLSHSTASRLLSRSLFIYHALRFEQMSASQIARILASLESSLYVPYKAIQVIAKKLGYLPAISVEKLQEIIWPEDSNFANYYFTDSTLEGSIDRCQELCASWLSERNLSEYLRLLVMSPDGSKGLKDRDFWPYIQILHWCLLPIEFYDHPVSHLYEFNPRGFVATDLFSRYKIVSTNNPILNNAKAVAKLDSHWARNRSGENAHALVDLLDLLESLPFYGRREVGRVIRGWIVRLIELKSGEYKSIVVDDAYGLAKKLSKFVCSNESNTRGVLEQRVVDALSVLVFEKPGWKAKGLGDSVNASNFSSHKLGDVEFVNVDKRSAIAIEAHGGRVSTPYVNAHRKSLHRIVEQRLSESWGSLDFAENWRIKVIFVAHEFAVDLPNGDDIHMVPVEYEYWPYEKLIDMAFNGRAEDDISRAFHQYFIQVLNGGSVPQWIRDIAEKIIHS